MNLQIIFYSKHWLTMKKLMTIVCFLAVACLEADMPLSNLIEYDKATCLDQLEKVDDAELWDIFLEGQAKLFFDAEFQWIAKGAWWQQAENILEIGSGNGAYLSRLADQFQEKAYQGIEKLPMFAKQANDRYARNGLIFREGDAEIFDTQLSHSAEIVLFRLTLQHLKDPTSALKNAWHYLSSNGYVLIIDACDEANRTSHPIAVIAETLQLVAESQNKDGKGNRKITLELLQTLGEEKSSLSELYEIAFSNLDEEGNVLYESIRFAGEQDRRLYFNHSLLCLTLLHRTYQISIDLNKAYNELKAYLEDDEAWTSPGMHFLVLKKKNKC